MQIVALVPGGIGEQILFFPALDSLKKAYPSVDIDVVVEPRAKSAYRICQSVNQVILFDFNDRNSPADWANLLGVMRDRYYNIALSSQNRWSIGLLLWLAGTPVRIGYSSDSNGNSGSLFLTDTVPYKSEQYAAHAYHDLLTAIGIETPCPKVSINVPKSDVDWADEERKRLELDGSGYVLLYGSADPQITSGSGETPYPVSSWQAVIQDFQNRQPDLPIVLVRNEGVDSFAAELKQACPAVKFTQPGEIGKLAAMVAGANLLLCTNSIAMHLAVALDVYTLALFGESDPNKLLPKSDKFQAIPSSTGQLADIEPQTVLERVWGG